MPLQHSLRAWCRSIAAQVPTPWLMAGEALAVLCGTVLGALALHAVLARGAQPLLGQASMLLVVATAGAATVVALLCALNSRIRVDTSMRLAGYAWGFYAFVAMPMGVLDTRTTSGPVLPGAAVAVAAIFLVLLAFGFAESRPTWLSGPRAIAGGATLTALVIVASAVLPPRVMGVFDSDVTDSVLLAGWGLLACASIVRGLRSRSPVWWRMGFGLVLIAAAHALLLLAGTAIQFAVLRFIGFLVLLAALCLHTRTLVFQRRAAEAEAAERAAADEHAAAERRHEMRNALATLSSVTTLMTPRPDTDTVTGGMSIAAMIDDEFARLRGLLEGTAPGPDTSTAAVRPVLVRLVMLRRGLGAPITLDCPDGMVVGLPTATLAQVVTNLLANCTRHAPGAEVYVGVRQDLARCVVEVTDAGPGLTVSTTTAPTAGEGLGLALSSQLVEAAGGSLELRPATRFPTGTTALLRLPLAAGSPRHLAAVPTDARVAS